MEKTKTQLSKFLITLTYVLVIGGLLLFSAEKGVHFWLNKQLPELLNQNPNRKYDIRFSHAELNIRKKNLVLDGVSIIPSKMDSTIKNTALVKQFKIEQANLKSLFFQKEIRTSNLIVVEPQIIIHAQSDTNHQSKREINELWIDVFTRLSIANFEIVNASLKVIVEDQIYPVFAFDSMNLKVVNFKVDTSTIKDPFPIAFSRIEAHCYNIKIRMDTISLLNIGSIQLTDTEALLHQIELVPVLDLNQYLEVKRAKNDWLEIYIDKVNLNNFTWDLKKDKSAFYASSLYLDSTDLHTLTDQNFPKQNNGYKPLLAEMFRNLPFTFVLDSFVVINSNIQFETKPTNQNQTSLIFFNKLYASGYNLHNNNLVDKRTEFDIISNFMGETHIKVSYQMNVNDTFNRFKVDGETDDLYTNTLNDILQPLAGVETVGKIYGFDFNIEGNNYHSTGIINLEYDGLKVKILNPESSEKKFLLSAVSNMALRKSNIITDKRFRQGTIDLERDANKSILGFLWESIKDGMLDTLIPFELKKQKKREAR